MSSSDFEHDAYEEISSPSMLNSESDTLDATLDSIMTENSSSGQYLTPSLSQTEEDPMSQSSTQSDLNLPIPERDPTIVPPFFEISSDSDITIHGLDEENHEPPADSSPLPVLIMDPSSPDPIPVPNTPPSITSPLTIITSTPVNLRKRKMSELSPPLKQNSSSMEDDGQLCPICFDPWTNSGPHRLVAMKCGHLFGQLCVDKWMSSTPKARCPQCNALIKKKDIRPIYARTLKVLDTSERDRALKELEKEKELRLKMEMDRNLYKLRCDMTKLDCDRLRFELCSYQKEVEKLKTLKGRHFGSEANYEVYTPKYKFNLQKVVELNKEGGCRVMAAAEFVPLIAVSSMSKNPLYPGYGITKVSTLDLQVDKFMFLHHKEIKDIAFHHHDALVLSASLDKTVKLTNLFNNVTVQTYRMATDAWSCVWNKEGRGFYVGLKNGSVVEMDIRMPNGEGVSQIEACIPMSPVVGLQWVQRKDTEPISMNGILALQLSGCCMYEKTSQLYKQHRLPLDGRFTSLTLEPHTGHFLITSRPGLTYPKVRHMLAQISYQNESEDPMVIKNSCSCNILQTFEGGETQSLITRSKLFLNPSDESSALVCAGDEASQCAFIWDVNSGKCMQELKGYTSPVMDMCYFGANKNFFLSTLTKDTMRFYKWTNKY